MLGPIKLETMAPALFVVIWSTGWIAGKYASFNGDPLTFLAFRFCFSILVFAAIGAAMKAHWPTTKRGYAHAMISGLFLHTIYLGGVWWAINQGVPSSISGLLAALQPLLTAVFAYWTVAERLSFGQKLGLGLGFFGLLIAIAPDLAVLGPEAINAAILPLFVNVIAMIGVTIGTIYQKRYLQEGNLIPIATLQYLGAFFFILPAAVMLESLHLDWNAQSIATMIWAVLGLSVGAVMLLLFLIRKGQVSRAASLIYLIPPAVGIQAWILFDEDLTPSLIIGTLIVVIAVWLVNRKPGNRNSA